MKKIILKFLNQLKNDTQGFAVLDFILAMALVSVLSLILINETIRFNDKTKDLAAAEKLKRITIATEEYVLANYGTIDTLSAAEPIAITMQNLSTAGFLPSALLNASNEITNPYNQTHHVLIRNRGAGDLEAAIITLGPAIPRLNQGQISQFTGEKGAIVRNLAADCGLLTLPCFLGTYGGYAMSAQDFNGTATAGLIPTDGHLASVLFFRGGASIKPYLYRLDIGNPEANTMQTNIDMNDNQILGVDDIFLNSRGKWLSSAMFDSVIANHNETITKPTCPTNSPTATIFLSQSLFYDSGPGLPVAGSQVYAIDNGADWTVTIRVLTQNGWENPNNTLGKAVGFIKCQ